MQTRNYLTEKESRKKSTRQGIVFIVVFVMVFVSVIARFAVRPGTNEGFFSLVPTGDDAYKVAIDLVKPNIKSLEPAFPDNDFQYSKKSDSVYVVQSFYEAPNPKGADTKTRFAITIRYNGGSSTDDNNWTVEDLQYN